MRKFPTFTLRYTISQYLDLFCEFILNLAHSPLELFTDEFVIIFFIYLLNKANQRHESPVPLVSYFLYCLLSITKINNFLVIQINKCYLTLRSTCNYCSSFFNFKNIIYFYVNSLNYLIVNLNKDIY